MMKKVDQFQVVATAVNLSPRECEILNLASHGQTNEEIARALSLSTETVKSHVKNVLRKVEAHNRTHAVAIGLRQGFIQ